jgi:glycosyltransferase involved in cell wall biosynthesis
MNFSYLNNQVYPGHNVPLKPKVSVCLITYAHENYLDTCLQNILNQEVDFAYEIVIGEDCSPDKTAEIVKRYAEQFPEKIKAFIRPQNAGAKINFVHCFFECQGEYIVHIEGDDYWTNPQKLQTQVNFLDANPNASACFHNAEIIFEDGSGFAPQLINKPDQKKWINSADFLGEKETWFMATASVMMRSKYVQTLPEWFLKSKSGDIPLYVILAEQGPIGYIDRIMSVYRKNEGGMSYTDSEQSEVFLNNRIFMYSKINEHTQFKYKALIQNIIYEYLLLKVQSRRNEKKYLRKLVFFLKALAYQNPSNWKQVKTLAKEYLISPKTLLKYLNFRKKINDFLRFSFK